MAESHTRRLSPSRKRKRAPWVIQPAAERRATVRNYSKSVASPSLLLALEIRRNGASSLPLVDKLALIKRHPSEIAKYVVRLDPKFKLSDVRKVVEGRANALAESTINFMITGWVNGVISLARNEIPVAVEKRFRQYLKARKIPVNNFVLISAINEFISGQSVRSLSGSIDLPRIESIYIKQQKSFRGGELNKAHNINTYTGLLVRGQHFTLNQKKAVKRWLKRTLPAYYKKRIDVLMQHEGNFLEALREIGILEAQFIASARSVFANEFSSKERIVQKEVVVKPSKALVKAGSREQRMNNYVPRVKEAERKKDLAERSELARSSGRAFDTGAYCLAEITRENAITGRRLAELAGRGAVSASGIQSLFTAGSLAQRIFVLSLDAGFEGQFGSAKINSLAKVLGYIGSRGRIITHVEKVFQSSDAKKMIDFLDREKLIELGHSGGDVVYLARSKTQR